MIEIEKIRLTELTEDELGRKRYRVQYVDWGDYVFADLTIPQKQPLEWMDPSTHKGKPKPKVEDVAMEAAAAIIERASVAKIWPDVPKDPQSGKPTPDYLKAKEILRAYGVDLRPEDSGSLLALKVAQFKERKESWRAREQ